MTPPAVSHAVAALGSRLVREGELQVLSANTPFVLGDLETVWWVESGAVDVFSVGLENGAPSGSRRPFCSVPAHEALFGFGPPVAGRGLLAVPGPDSRLRRLSLGQFRALAGDTTLAPALAQRIDRWIVAVSAGVARDVPGRIDAQVDPSTPQTVAANARCRARRDVAWLFPDAGEWLFLGMEEVGGDPAAGCFPLAPEAWMQALGPRTFTCVPTLAFLATEDLWRGFASFQKIVARCEAMNRQLGEVDDLNRQRDRAAAGDRATAQALAELSAVLDGAAPPPESKIDDVLFRTCLAIGRVQGIAFQPPAELVRGEPVADPLPAIARASSVRTRQVALDGTWWRQDGGPLLGFRAEGHQPVALLPAGPGRYLLHDASNRTEHVVDAATAALLEPVAHVFYRPFPQAAITVREVIRFGAFGLKPDLFRLLLLGLGGGLLSTLPAVANALVFDSLVPLAAYHSLVQLTLGLIGVALAVGVFEFTRGLALLRIEGRLDGTLQAAVIDRLLKLPATFFRQFAAGDLAQRALGVTELRKLLAHALIAAGLGNLFAWVNVLVLATIDLRLALIACGLIAVTLAFSAAVTWQQIRVQRRVASQQGLIAGIALQLISGIARLRVAGAEDFAFSTWARPFAHLKRDAAHAQRLGYRVLINNALFPPFASAVLFWFVAPRAGFETLSVGAFLAFTAAFASLLTGLLAFTAGVASALNVVPLFERIQPILQAVPETNAAKLSPGTLAGRIELSHVSFRYGAGLPLVLDDLSLDIAPGEFVAIVGESGSGKSTLLRLLLGFETPERGAIHYDGHDLAHLDVAAVRRQLGVVLQTSQPTAGSILVNVAGARPLTHDEVWEALRLAGLESDIREMPMGLHTVLPASGSVLSGGQRQRLMIARAVVSKPRILLFDEATSALDNRTQAQVSRSIEQLAATRVVIAHRLSTVRHADRIVVMVGGKVAQNGRYDELVAQPGPFAELAARQRAETGG